MSLAIVGTGLVSPAGLTPRANACVLWAGAVPVSASPFVRDDGEPVPVCYCPWLGARMSVADRVLAMGRAAVEDAVRPLRSAPRETAIPLLLCMPETRGGLAPTDRARIATALAEVSAAREARTLGGAASFFAALREAEALLDADATAVAVGAVDSYIGEEPLTEHVANPSSPWGATPPPAAEGAAALVVMKAAEARRLGLKPVGTIHFADTAIGQPNDDNDLPADGEAMGSLLRRLPRRHVPAPLVFGQFTTDSLRHAEWQLAVARNPERVHPEYEMRSFEGELGLVGAAVGGMNLVYGLAVAHHRTTDMGVGDHDPLLAWAVSRDGERGLSMVSVEP
jgi:hypothetical protein